MGFSPSMHGAECEEKLGPYWLEEENGSGKAAEGYNKNDIENGAMEGWDTPYIWIYILPSA